MANAKNEFTFWREGSGGAIIVKLTNDGKFESVYHNGSSGSYPEDQGEPFAELWLREALDLDINQFKKIAESINKKSGDYIILLNVVHDKINKVKAEYNATIKELQSIL